MECSSKMYIHLSVCTNVDVTLVSVSIKTLANVVAEAPATIMDCVSSSLRSKLRSSVFAAFDNYWLILVSHSEITLRLVCNASVFYIFIICNMKYSFTQDTKMVCQR